MDPKRITPRSGDRGCCDLLPVGGDVAHEQDAGVHVQVERRGAEAAVDFTEGQGFEGEVGDPDGEAEAEEEVGHRQVLQVDGDAARHPLLGSAEVHLQGETVEEQTHLRSNRRQEPPSRLDLTQRRPTKDGKELTANSRL